jgi:sulfide:quinone oxidoreductase
VDRKRIVVVGTSFAGYTGALELKALVGDNHDVTVVANTHKFVFIPSLIWVPFGLRDEEDISFDVRPVYEKKGVKFIESRVTAFDLERRLVRAEEGEIPYDYVLIATGPKVDFASIPGLRPGETSWSICTIAHALETRAAWQRFLEAPGPIVVGATQGAACFGAAYEFIPVASRRPATRRSRWRRPPSTTSLPPSRARRRSTCRSAISPRCASSTRATWA